MTVTHLARATLQG